MDDENGIESKELSLFPTYFRKVKQTNDLIILIFDLRISTKTVFLLTVLILISLIQQTYSQLLTLIKCGKCAIHCLFKLNFNIDNEQQSQINSQKKSYENKLVKYFQGEGVEEVERKL